MGQIKVDSAIGGADNSGQLIYVFFPRVVDSQVFGKKKQEIN
jgi:hypothetical protein